MFSANTASTFILQDGFQTSLILSPSVRRKSQGYWHGVENGVQAHAHAYYTKLGPQYVHDRITFFLIRLFSLDNRRLQVTVRMP